MKELLRARPDYPAFVVNSKYLPLKQTSKQLASKKENWQHFAAAGNHLLR